MKTLKYFLDLILTMALMSLFIMCSDDENPTEPNNNLEVVGIWKVSKMSWSAPSESGTYSQSQLDSLGFIWQLTFNSDKTAEQMTNINGPTITQECTWSTNGDVLTLTLKESPSSSINFKYVIANNILTLDWSIPSGAEYVAELTKQ